MSKHAKEVTAPAEPAPKAVEAPKTYTVWRAVEMGHPNYIGPADPEFPHKEPVTVPLEDLTRSELRELGL